MIRHAALSLAALLPLVACAQQRAYPSKVMDQDAYQQSNRAPECEELTHPDSRASCIRDREAAQVRAAQEAQADAELLARLGPVAGYAHFGQREFRRCADLADQRLSGSPSRMGMLAVSDCVAAALSRVEPLLAPALAAAATPDVSAQVKALHAYLTASLRALQNVDQSVIEARQDRADRRAGLDERVTRLQLDL